MSKKHTMIVEALQNIKEELGEIKKLDAVQNEQLASHMRRTELLEKYIHSTPQRILLWVSILGGLATLAKLILSSHSGIA